MRYFITENTRYTSIEGYKILHPNNCKDLISDFIKENEDLTFDIETNGLDPYVNKPLLYGLASTKEVFTVDHYSVNKKFIKSIFKKIKNKDIRLIGHNIKFDINFVQTNESIWIKKVYDTMIAEQRLWQKLGLKNSYAALAERYLGLTEETIDKRVRTEFIGANPATFKIEKRHLDYLCSDLTPLYNIKAKQDENIYKKQLYNLIYKIEMPLVSIVSKAEIEGFDFNSEKWKEIYEINLEKKFKIEQELDIEFRKLREEVYLFSDRNKEDYLRCHGGQFDHERVRSPLLDVFEIDGTPKALDLFGNPLTSKQVTGVKKKINFYPNNINYGSDTKIMELFGHLKQPLMTKVGAYTAPKFYKGKVDKRHRSFLTNEKAFKKRLIDYPDSKMDKFIKLLLEHRKLSTRVSTFGPSFLSSLNPITGKIHTEFRQCRAVTARFQSGNARNKKPNFQNIPADNSLRSCFIAPKGYKIITADYSGAELIVMCSLSQDMDLLEMSKRDMHSEIATACWKEVYKFKAKKYQDLLDSKNSVISVQELRKHIEENTKLANEFYVDKSPEKVHMRTAFKPITFGVIYGLRDKSLAEYLSIEVEEARIIINTIEKLFPKVFKMVKAYSKFAERNGYIILNDRTYSRAYFPNIIKELQGEYNRDFFFKEIMKDINEARNMPIQGTQADFIKEASVNIQDYIDHYNLDATILSWVHDEIVTKCNDKHLGEENKTLSFIDSKGKVHLDLDFAEVKRLIMNDTANQYLKNVTIDTDYKVEQNWIK